MKRLALLLPLLALAAGPVLAEEPADKPPLKVLAIGNSFSQSLCPSLFMAAEDAGEKLEFCNLCIGGCSLERHAENIAKAGAAPGFAPYEATWYRTDGYAKFNANVPQMLATQAWDVVTIQQASHESWNPGSFHPWADAVVAAVRSLAPGAEIVVHETWSYNAADARIGGKFPDWPFGQAGMYSRLETNYLALARSFGLRTIPVGLAVQKRRAALAAAGRGFDPAALDEAKPLQDPDLRGEPVGSFWWDKATAIEPDRPMRRDTIHLNKAGQYLQTMTWLGFLFGRDVRASDGYRPSSDRVARFLGVVDDAAALRSAAQDALDEAKARGWQDFAPKKAGGVSRAEGAELLPEQVGVGSRPDEGEDKHVVAAAAGCATRPATSCATVAVTRVVPSETEIPGRILPFDPIFLRSQFDVICSTPVLSPVVLSNDLASVLDAAYGWHMACPDAAADRAVACLRKWTNLSIWKDTDLIGIEVSVDRAVPGAEALSRKLAGDIARSYRANAIALREAEAKATAAQLQSEIDSIRKRIAESEPKDRQALESRLSKLRERLGWYGTWYGTLVPYVDVRIMDDPERPGSGTRGPGAEKWKRIVLPIVDYRQSSVVDVVAELEDLARNYDDFVAAARGQGVTFVLDVPADAVDSLPLVTCKMKSVSVYSAIDTIAEMSGLEWSVDGDVIRLTLAPGRPAADETHAEAEDGVDGGCFGAAPSAEN